MNLDKGLAKDIEHELEEAGAKATSRKLDEA